MLDVPHSHAHGLEVRLMRGVHLKIRQQGKVITGCEPVPGQHYSFGVVKAAQARGDFQVLVERGRRLLRVHLGTDVRAGLVRLRSVIEEALV